MYASWIKVLINIKHYKVGNLKPNFATKSGADLRGGAQGASPPWARG